MNELKELKEKYEKQKRVGRISGIVFLVLAFIFTILGFALGKPQVFNGVILQIIAGIILLVNNK